ncbi:hypothetical protein IW261DRAFT_1577246 [Armillaria novae-zelandiae]|uniref:Uncharacterized protein n=1 Tax=Armillaria novae-zelandiae TaxID=153914 RepID=A0AA39N898_9AGAR|nr:hypothetical protein IW261DRAFT_1577246 [Armillaria novae-zelandiae]
MSTEGLVYSHKIPLDEFCCNLIAPELVRVVEDAHLYLDAHMDTLHDFGLSNSRYGLALRGRVARIINLIPTISRQQEWTWWQLKMEEFNRDKLEFDASHCLPGEEEYMANASHCVAENDLHPFRMHSLPVPHCPQVAALSAKPSADVAVTMPLYVSDGMVESESGGEGDAAEATISGWDHEAIDKSVSDKIVVLPFKHLRVNGPSLPHPAPPHAYHPVTGEPLSGLKYISFAAFLEPAQSLSVVKSAILSKGKGKVVEPPSAVVSLAPSSSLTTDVIDNTIYLRTFHPSVDLQYHEPPSRQALESMTLSLLPAAPDSLTKPVGQIRSGQEYVYQCHSDRDPYFIRPPLLNWPCFNCTLAGYPDQCIFEGGIGEECCTQCKSSCHSRCSARWDANQLRQATTLLDPLTLSGDTAICCSVQRVDRINSEIELLGRAMQLLRSDHEAVIGEIADGLDAIACHEHGTEIVNAYSQVSGFLKSFIVHVGGAASQSSNGDAGADDD